MVEKIIKGFKMTQSEKKSPKSQISELLIKIVFIVAAVFSIIAVVSIVAFLLVEAFPSLIEIGLIEFLFGTTWSPTNDSYGIFTLIVGSVFSTAGALIVGGLLGYFTAIYISKFCPKKLKNILSQVVSLLAGIPSIIYGYFGMQVVLPMLGFFDPTGSGTGLLSVSLILGFMIVPTIVSLSVSALDAVPDSYYEGARALGCSHEQAVFGAVVPAAKSGITASIILGIGRALGETMAVVLVAGNNASNFPSSLFLSFRTMTANIVLEMGYAMDTHRGALIGIAVVLLCFTLVVIMLFRLITSSAERPIKESKNLDEITMPGKLSYILKGKYSWMDKAKSILAIVCSALTVCVLVWIVVYIFIMGLPYLNIETLFLEFGISGQSGSIMTSVLVTLVLVGLAILFAVPIGVGAAIYLTEYTKKGSKFTQVIRTAVEVLAGIPSIVFGLFGMIVFVGIMNGGTYSILCGALTITLMIIPIIVRSTEESLIAVSDGFREGSFALGAGKARTIFKIVLPSAFAGILASIILAMGRVMSESAPLIFTMGTTPTAFTGITGQGTSLAVMMYYLCSEGQYINLAWGVACILIIMVFALNIISTVAGNAIRKRMTRV